MIVSKGVRVGTDFGEGEVVAVTKEWLIVDVGSSIGEVAVNREDDTVWVVPTGYVLGGGNDSFEASELAEE